VFFQTETILSFKTIASKRRVPRKVQIAHETTVLTPTIVLGIAIALSSGPEVLSEETVLPDVRLFRTHLAPRHMAGVVVVFYDADGTAFVWIALHDRERPVGSKRLDGFRPAIVIVVANLMHQDPVRVLLNEIDLPVEVAVAFDLDDRVPFHPLDEVRGSVAVSIDRDLVFVLADPLHPLIGPTVAPAMSDHAVGASVAGEKRES